MAHHALYYARQTLPGHAVYGKVRNACELLEVGRALAGLGRCTEAAMRAEAALVAQLLRQRQRPLLRIRAQEDDPNSGAGEREARRIGRSPPSC